MLLRVAWILIGHTYKFKTSNDNFSFGWEMGRIGAALASGHGFSNPLGPATGPTAWEPPLYPYLTAGVFLVFGIYSKASAFVLLTLNSVFSALTCIPIFLIARRIFSEQVAVWSAWAWALLPNVMFWCTRVVWETSLAALLLTTIFWLALTLEDRDGWMPWFQFGLLWGITALSSTSLLSFLPAAGLWAWVHRARRGKKSLAGVVLASAVFFACIAPWLVRNYETFGKFIFIRDNFGAELRLGNGPGADGTWMEYLHPTQDAYAMRQYQAMGELPYIAMRKRQAVDYIKADYRTICRPLPSSASSIFGLDRQSHAALVDERCEELTLPGFVGSDVLGIGPRPALAQTGRVAAVLAVIALSSDVLLRVLHPAPPASY